jgi:VCBS repeat-containing protein
VATVSLTVTPVNDPVSPQPDAYSVNEDTTLNVAAPGLLANDSDVDGDSLRAVPGRQPAHGSLTLNEDGSFAYTPTANYNGADSFTYWAGDSKGGGREATVSLTVTPVNDAPVATPDIYSTSENVALTVAASGVLANDTDVEQNAMTASLVSGPANGTLNLNANGSFTYTPAPGFVGTDSFNYRASDAAAGPPATVTITVRNVIDVKPGVASDVINLKKESSVQVAILSTAAFNAPQQVVTSSLRFGRTGTEATLVYNGSNGQPLVEARDVNGDGLLDLVATFSTSGLRVGDALARLRWTLTSGISQEGIEAVTVIRS